MGTSKEIWVCVAMQKMEMYEVECCTDSILAHDHAAMPDNMQLDPVCHPLQTGKTIALLDVIATLIFGVGDIFRFR